MVLLENSLFKNDEQSKIYRWPNPTRPKVKHHLFDRSRETGTFHQRAQHFYNHEIPGQLRGFQKTVPLGPFDLTESVLYIKFCQTVEKETTKKLIKKHPHQPTERRRAQPRQVNGAKWPPIRHTHGWELGHMSTKNFTMSHWRSCRSHQNHPQDESSEVECFAS